MLVLYLATQHVRILPKPPHTKLNLQSDLPFLTSLTQTLSIWNPINQSSFLNTDSDDNNNSLVVANLAEVQQLDNRSRQPKKGDLITYFSHDFDVWLHFKIISKAKARSKYTGYYNICYLDIDREDNGIYFNMDPFWSVQEDMEKREPDKQPKLLRYTSDCNSVHPPFQWTIYLSVYKGGYKTE